MQTYCDRGPCSARDFSSLSDGSAAEVYVGESLLSSAPQEQEFLRVLCVICGCCLRGLQGTWQRV